MATDVGCGSGDLTFMIDEMLNHKVEIIGIDISEQMLRIAEDRKNGRTNMKFIKSDIISLPKDLGLFDAIIGRRVLMCLPNIDERIKSLKDHLKENGSLYAL